MEEKLYGDDSSAAAAGPAEEDFVNRESAGSTPTVTPPAAHLGESDFYLCRSDPAETRELFRTRKTEIVARCRTLSIYPEASLGGEST